MKKMTDSSLKITKKCSHCDTEFISTKIEDKGSDFCCFGCETVYNILKSNNLDHYYNLKKDSIEFRPANPVSPSKHKFDYLDQETTDTIDLYLEGVHCVACLWLIENLNTLTKEVKSVHLNIGTSHLRLTKESFGLFSNIAVLLDQLGYYPHLLSNNDIVTLEKNEHRSSLLRLGITAALAGNIMIFSVALYLGSDGGLADVFRWVSAFLSLPIVIYSALPFYKGAKGAFLSKKMTIDVPVVVAICSGTIISVYNLINNGLHIYFDSISIFVFLLLATRHFFKYTSKKLNNDQSFLSAIIPLETKKMNSDTTYTFVKSTSLMAGDIIEIIENDVIAADGYLYQCTGYVDAHVITGESEPVYMKSGESVYAGMKNCGETFHVCVESVGIETRLGQLTQHIKSYKKTKMVQMADTVSKWFLLITILIAGILFFLDVVINHSLELAFNRSLALIILACPCALSLATPLSYAISVSKAAKHGICIKNSDIIEKIADVTTVVFDKTGTLTQGQLSVKSWENDIGDHVFSIVKALELETKHPVGKAILRYLEEQKIECVTVSVSNKSERLGKGVEGSINGIDYKVMSIPIQLDQTDSYLLNAVGLFQNDRVISRIILEDSLLDSSFKTLSLLQNEGVKTVLLSGDRKETVEHVCNQLNMNDYFSEKGPDEKVAIIESMPNSLMIGDGANDAMALSKACVSVAVQGSLEVSLVAADVYFTTPGVSNLPLLFDLSKRTRRIVRLNFVFSLFYNCLGILLVVSGYISPLFAAILMPISSLTVFLISVIGLR